ncbi:MAG TPA: PadR family transcriptional regulator [Acidimicrobiales bacterium]|nr:PadR family transcriptional regulator [Acidimicrobiales bacterium]
MAPREDLSLRGWAVLGLVAEGATHGFAVSRAFARDGPIGRIWTIPRPLVYRALASLEGAGLVREVGSVPGERGPDRRVIEATPEGRAALRTWLAEPVGHVRDARSELLVKLLLLDRAGEDPLDLLRAQAAWIHPVLVGLREKLTHSDGFDATLARWRVASAEALEGFLVALITDRERGRGSGAPHA